MGAGVGKGFPGSQAATIQNLSGNQRPLPKLNNPALMPGRQTLPIAGAPRIPANPALYSFLQRHRKPDGTLG